MQTLKPSRRFWTITAAVLIALLALTGLAHAKMIPYIEPLDGDWGGLDDPYVIDRGQYLAGYFGRLAEPGDLDVLALTFDAPVEQMFNALLVPVCGDQFVDFYPTVAIIGPGLDQPDAETLAGLPSELADLPLDVGVLIFPYNRFTPDRLTSAASSSGRPKANWELFDQGHYDELIFNVDIPQAGEYLFAIWSPKDTSGGETGAYVLMTGAVHPEPDVFPSEMDLDAVFQTVNRGAWIGWDCAE